MDEPATPPENEGWLGGGMAAVCFAAKLDSKPLLANWLPWDRSKPSSPTFVSPLVAVACEFVLSEETSLSKGEEGIGDADFLLCASPLPFPPREEFLGETRPV
jgi:hypothetical protein